MNLGRSRTPALIFILSLEVALVTGNGKLVSINTCHNHDAPYNELRSLLVKIVD